jgi:hypothetical protein
LYRGPTVCGHRHAVCGGGGGLALENVGLGISRSLLDAVPELVQDGLDARADEIDVVL